LDENSRQELLNAYEFRKQWPPYTYREYFDATPEILEEYAKFLDTENTNKKKMELQPWITFCDSRCSFCYYPSTMFKSDFVDPYLDALKKELKMYSETRYVKTSEFDEIVLGGGTPSVLSAEQLIEIISFCKENFNISKDYMIKITGSTHNLDEYKLKKFAEYGVLQLDVGVQTFNNEIRRRLCIPDSGEHAEEIIRKARELGLYVCIDLMYNLPGQTLEMWREDVQKAIHLELEGVDCYPLEVYPGTMLEKQIESGAIPPPGDWKKEALMYVEAIEMFTKAGYVPVGHDRFTKVREHIEESCLNGWPWAGILTTGAGCFMGYLGRYSYQNIENIYNYMEKVGKGIFPIAKIHKSSDEDMIKKVMERLYLRLPVSKEEFLEKFGKLPEEVFPEAVKRLKEKGLIEVDSKEIRITKLGDIWRINIAWEFANAKAAY
jgi:oxygen-independent coproporphyrinogen-3 oxidase